MQIGYANPYFKLHFLSVSLVEFECFLAGYYDPKWERGKAEGMSNKEDDGEFHKETIYGRYSRAILVGR